MSMNKPHMLALQITSQTQTDYSPSYIPEKGLLAGVLERAVRDLGLSGCYTDRRTAIEWFKKADKLREDQMQEGFTYMYVAHNLGLSKWQMDHIRRLVDQAILYQDNLKKKKGTPDVRLFPGNRPRP
jgi:hypothetical protein